MFDFSPVGIAALLIRLPVILLALVFHEFAHAWTADRLGDPTARSFGRITLNPLRHLDPLGTILLLFAPIGWAKPVPVNPYNFRNPGRDDILVSAAGPMSNLLQAIFYVLLLRLPWEEWAIRTGPGPTGSFMGWIVNAGGMQQLVLVLWLMVSLGVLINVGLMVFNLLPFFPLDGHHIARENLRGEARQRFMELQRFGPAIIIGLVLLENMTPIHPISWPIRNLVNLLLSALGGGQNYLLG